MRRPNGRRFAFGGGTSRPRRPSGCRTAPDPALIGEQGPHRIFVTRRQVVLVDPKEDKLAEMIE
jgi:hypothetical protein